MSFVTPLGWAADRWALGPRSLRWASTAALVVSLVIILSGGVVRVTSSGLGCPTWPACDATQVIAPISANVHQVIEQANRLLTGLIVIVVAWVIVAARLQRPRDRRVTRLAWSQFWLVVANAVVGGISVLALLNPWVVAAHFIMAIALLTTTTLTWHVVHADPQRVIVTTPLSKRLAWVLMALTFVLVCVGTMVSGSGPHSGDSSDVARIPFDWAAITAIHGSLGGATIVVAAVLWLTLRGADARTPRLRVSVFFVVCVLQAVLGLVQALTHLPETEVAFHLLGAGLVWAGALRVLLDTNGLGLRRSAVTAPASSSVAA
ncbi:COX15/CtaA family protein [Gryllotalpicola sp.]|uniref:COX15/CtaA family protein n=1 Tax=Gryllotalpicola sp. TaxID=1932787 RepID=UPI00260FEC53|nr:COX15/CtaA family protein [Gryllotalpicola sp.]